MIFNYKFPSNIANSAFFSDFILQWDPFQVKY